MSAEDPSPLLQVNDDQSTLVHQKIVVTFNYKCLSIYRCFLKYKHICLSAVLSNQIYFFRVSKLSQIVCDSVNSVNEFASNFLKPEVPVDLQGCLPKNHSHAPVLCYNHRKVYIIVKVIKCRIRGKNFFGI